MSTLYYFAANTDSGCVISCGHEHATLVGAVACLPTVGAGGYVIAFQDGQERTLDQEEQLEVHAAIYGGWRNPAPFWLRRRWSRVTGLARRRN